MLFIPTAQDWLENLKLIPWMQNGFGEPPSSAKLRYTKGINKEMERNKSIYID